VNAACWLAATLAVAAAAAALAPTSGRTGQAARTAAPPPARSSTHLPALTTPPVPVLSTLVLSCAAGLAVTVLLGGPVGAVLGVVAGAVSWKVARAREPAAERRRREQLERQVPHVIDLMAATLSVGASPTAALDRVAGAVPPPMSEELADVGARLRLGTDPVRVWADLGSHRELGALGRCLARSADSGSSVAEAMRGLAEDQRRNARADATSRARTVGVTAAAPLGLCLLPAFVLIGIVPLVAGSVAAFLHR
jgi:Flp pilus assembly protein TadB